ncbi:Cobalamin biosynthesis protein CobN-related Mg-chelatase [Thermoplasmatales archaeon BRNA1]|nr:Cobalamin biosynthesis protein CobN-related Mg-chelatase [Thermoplasmatales archaeon BRNA1]
MVRIAGFGVGSHEGFVLEGPISIMRSQGYDIEFHGADSVTLDDDIDELKRFLDVVKGCDIIFLYVHGDVSYFRHWGNLREVIDTYGISAFMTGCDPEIIADWRYMFRQDDECFRTLTILSEIGGDENNFSVVKKLLNMFDNAGLKVPDPVRPMAQGVYVPGRGAFTFEEGLKDVGSTGRPVVLITFVYTFYIRHNTRAMDELYHAVERAGGEPLAIFYKTYADEVVGSIGVSAIVDRYLLRDGKPIVDAVINTIGFSSTLIASPGCGEQVSEDNFYERLNVPVIQAINLYGPAKAWRESPFGLGPADIAMSVVDPEFDGQIDGVPYCGTEKMENGDYKQVPIEERCSALAEMAVRWGTLTHRKQSEKKVAILIYMYPPRQDLAGGGYGLDTFASVTSMLERMKDAGYALDWVPEDGKDLVNRMLEGITNDDNWRSEAQMREAAVDMVTKEQYDAWFDEIAESARKRFVEAWGDTPGDIHVLDGKILLPGIMNGNVFIGFQPDRGKCTTESVHDPWTAPPHQYLGFYRWLKYVWGADAVVHIGTHGTLEWLPGKSAGLSDECDPDIVLSKLPNINPYIIDNPGEGMQSKRRQYAVTTTHLIPAMARSGGYDEINELESAVQSFLKAKEQKQTDKLPLIMEKVISLCVKLNMMSDLNLSADATAEEMDSKIDKLYDYILEVKDALIKDGLHILGQIPEGERMAETLYMLVRYRNGDVPSLREAVAHTYGLEMEDLLKDPSGVQPDGHLNGEMTDIIDAGMYELIEKCQEYDFDASEAIGFAVGRYPNAGEDMKQAIEFVCGFLIDAVRHMGDEIGNVLKALGGGFVPPGPSGCPGRGRAQILPTGRNFYSIDPDSIPWHSSWEIGSKMAEQMVERYIQDNGVCPQTIGIILWATDTMKTGGDDVAYILRLMGLRPVWDGYGGRVKDVEVIPIEELGRPRIDVTVRISGLFRDTFPNLSNLIDRGV